MAALDAIDGIDFSGVDATLSASTENVDGGATGGEVRFTLEFSANRNTSLDANTTVPASLGREGHRLGFTFDPAVAVDVTSGLSFALTFGLDVGQSPPEFFIRSNGFDLTADVTAPSLPPGPITAGFFRAQVTGGSMNLNADLAVTLNDADGTITEAELLFATFDTSQLDTQLTVNGSGSADADVTFDPDTLGAFDPLPGGGTANVSFMTNDPFTPPKLTFDANFDALRPFANLNANSFLSTLGQLGSWLEDLLASSILVEDLQLIDGTLGDILPLGELLDSERGLIADLLDPVNHTPLFQSAPRLGGRLKRTVWSRHGECRLRTGHGRTDVRDRHRGVRPVDRPAAVRLPFRPRSAGRVLDVGHGGG